MASLPCPGHPSGREEHITSPGPTPLHEAPHPCGGSPRSHTTCCTRAVHRRAQAWARIPGIQERGSPHPTEQGSHALGKGLRRGDCGPCLESMSPWEQAQEPGQLLAGAPHFLQQPVPPMFFTPALGCQTSCFWVVGCPMWPGGLCCSVPWACVGHQHWTGAEWLLVRVGQSGQVWGVVGACPPHSRVQACALTHCGGKPSRQEGGEGLSQAQLRSGQSNHVVCPPRHERQSYPSCSHHRGLRFVGSSEWASRGSPDWGGRAGGSSPWGLHHPHLPQQGTPPWHAAAPGPAVSQDLRPMPRQYAPLLHGAGPKPAQRDAEGWPVRTRGPADI